MGEGPQGGHLPRRSREEWPTPPRSPPVRTTAPSQGGKPGSLEVGKSEEKKKKGYGREHPVPFLPAAVPTRKART